MLISAAWAAYWTPLCHGAFGGAFSTSFMEQKTKTRTPGTSSNLPRRLYTAALLRQLSRALCCTFYTLL